MNHNLTMRLKILIFCLGSTLIGLFLQSALFQNSSSRLIYNQAKEESQRSLQNMQDDLNTFIKKVENGLLQVYNQKEFIADMKRDVDSTQMKETYHRVAYNLATDNFDTTDAVLAMYVYNAEHEIISTYRRAVTPKHNYPVDIYDAAAEDNAEVVRSYAESDNSQMLITSYYNKYRQKDIVRFVIKMFSYTNTNPQIGYIVCDIDSKTILGMMKKYRVDEEMYIWLQPLGDRPMVAMGTLNKDSKKTFQTIAEKVEKSKTEITQWQDGQRVFFAIGQKKYNLWAYAIMPETLLNQSQKVLTQNLILITVIMLIVITLSFLLVSREITRPLEQMTATVQEIQNGNTQLRMKNLKNDEVGKLGKSFNNMLDQIESLIAKEYESELMKNRAEYQALQTQINPHFLYNTLDTMSSIAEIQDCFQVSALCQSLAGMFRYSLNMKEPLSTVSQEMVHLKNYCYVMNVRMHDQVKFEYEIDDQSLQDSLPRISIQPLVENAINHGLRNKKGEKKVWIQINEQGADLLVKVRDNGIGIREEKISEIFEEKENSEKKRTSVGIINIHKRLKLLYGEQCGIQIESEEADGTTVWFRIPISKKERTEHGIGKI